MSLTTGQTARFDYLKRLVKIRIDEYMESSDAETDLDFNIGDIGYELTESVKFVLSVVPRQITFRMVKNDIDLYVVKDTVSDNILVVLPDDYMRFISMKITGWKRPVTKLKPDDSEEYNAQQFKYRRGTKEKPVGFLVPNTDSIRITLPANTFLAYVVSGQVIEGEPVTIDDFSVGDAFAETEGAQRTATITEVNKIDGYLIFESTDEWIADEQLTGPSNKLIELSLLPAEEYERSPYTSQAVEAYPLADGLIESFKYVPYVAPYDAPPEIEDVLIWHTVSRVMGQGERYEGMKFAEAEFKKSLSVLTAKL